MKRILWVLPINIFISNILTAQLTARSIHDQTYYSIGYLEYLPPDYHTETRTYPLLIFLHGGGETGDGSPEQLERVKSWGPPNHVAGLHNMCFVIDGEDQCFIVIAPQLSDDLDFWDPDYTKVVINHILNGPDFYRVDRQRIYLTGLSRGGHGVYFYAQSYSNEPNQLAAIAPIAAWKSPFMDGCIIAERKIPIWAFHGDLDPVVPYPQGLEAFNNVKNCRDPEPQADLMFTTYKGRYHDSWIPAYLPSHDFHEPNLYEWLLKYTLDQPTSTNKPTLNSVSIYPNPVRDHLYVNIDERSIGSISIRHISGVVVKKPNEKLIDVSDLIPGVYIIEVCDHTGTLGREKIIKVR